MTRLRTLPEALAAAATGETGYRFLAEDGSERWFPYVEFAASAARLGGGLRALGVQPGERVALVIQEPEGFLTAFFGISLAGMIPVPVCPPGSFGAQEAYLATTEHVLQVARVSVLLTSEGLDAALAPRAAQTGVRIVRRWNTLEGPALASFAKVAPTDPAFLQFTSGSTAEPKGVVLSHANLAANVEAIGGPAGLALAPGDVGVSWLPLHHDMGLIGMALTPLYFGVSSVILSPVLFLKRPTEWLKAIHRLGGTCSFAPSFAYDLCLRRVKPGDIEQLDLSKWRVAGCGAEPVRADTLEGFAQVFGPAGFRASAFIPSYGMAEHTLAVTFARRGEPLDVDRISAEGLVDRRRAESPGPRDRALRIVNCGRPFPGHQVRIVDEDGTPLPEGAIGEITLAGPSVMQGYFDNPEATARAIRGGWLHTGDEGYLRNGDLFVCGRQKDIVIVNGRNFYPEDLEWAVGELPGVRSGNVVAFGVGGLSADGDRERVIVVVESKGKMPGPELAVEVRRRIVESVGLQVDEVVVAPPGTVQRTTSGKVRRSKLKSHYESGAIQNGHGSAR